MKQAGHLGKLALLLTNGFGFSFHLSFTLSTFSISRIIPTFQVVACQTFGTSGNRSHLPWKYYIVGVAELANISSSEAQLKCREFNTVYEHFASNRDC